jgi:hypothetical protein
MKPDSALFWRWGRLKMAEVAGLTHYSKRRYRFTDPANIKLFVIDNFLNNSLSLFTYNLSKNADQPKLDLTVFDRKTGLTSRIINGISHGMAIDTWPSGSPFRGHSTLHARAVCCGWCSASTSKENERLRR